MVALTQTHNIHTTPPPHPILPTSVSANHSLHLDHRLAQHGDGGELTGGSGGAGNRDRVDIGGRSGILYLSGIRVWSWRDINVKWRGQVCSCPIMLHPVTANQGANNRRKGLIALDSAPTTGPIIATYWLPVLVQTLVCRAIVWNFQHGLWRSEWGETVGIKSWIVGRAGAGVNREWCELVTCDICIYTQLEPKNCLDTLKLEKNSLIKLHKETIRANKLDK